MTKERVDRIVQSVSVGAALASIAAGAYWPQPNTSQWVAVAFFGSFGILASLLGYKTTKSTSGTIGFLPFLSVALISPNAGALVAVFLSVASSEILGRRDRRKAIFNVAQQVGAEVLAVATYRALGGSTILEARPPITAFIAMVACFFVVNKLAVSIVVAADVGGSARRHFQNSMRSTAAYDVFAFPLILLFSVAYREFGPQWSAAFAIPMLGLRQLYKQNFALQKINEELLQLMVAAIEARDPYTSGHSQRVQRYARFIAGVIGITGKAAERIATAALLHDVGKIHEEFAPILRKPGRLTDEEFSVMKTHPDKGATLVGKVTHFLDLVPAIQSHHEGWDGRGYPRRISGENIPTAARVIALADTIDAMCSSRPYRKGLSPEVVRAEIEKQSGRQFDPKMCSLLLQEETWRQMVVEIAMAHAEHPEAVDPSFGIITARETNEAGETLVSAA
jgi:HD superfamily phosphohydrolase YqeK